MPTAPSIRRLSRPEREHAAEKLRREAAHTRAAALAALSGPRIETAARKTIEEAISRIAAALDKLPDDVADAETATAAGPEAAAAWAAIVADDTRAAGTWGTLDEARRVGIVPVPLIRGDFDSRHSDLACVLLAPGSHHSGNYFAPVAHRARFPELITAKTTLSQMLRLGAEPGVYDAEEARGHIETYSARVLGEEPDTRT